MPTLTEITTFQFVLAIIGIPLVLGFLTEAGKDLWNIIRKKPDANSYMAICTELRNSCRNKDEITRLTKSNEIIVENQDTLRRKDMPAMNAILVRIEEQIKNMIEDMKEIKAVNIANAGALQSVVTTNAEAVKAAVILAHKVAAQ